MKVKILNIVAAVLTVAIATPFAMRADKTAVNAGFDTNIETYTPDTNEFIMLDTQAIEELEQLGIKYATVDDNPLADQIIEYATRYLGRPYRSGAKGPSAFDCSGFTSYIFNKYGIKLSPSSSAQATQGQHIATDQIRPGDLLFFGGRRGGRNVGHVALAVDIDDNGTITFIHASTSQGITYNKYPDGGYYSKRFLGARRVID